MAILPKWIRVGRLRDQSAALVSITESTGCAASSLLLKLLSGLRGCRLAITFRFKKWRSLMLWTIAVLLLILWMLGMVSSYTLGGFIHILLVLAIVAVLIRLIQGRSPVV